MLNVVMLSVGILNVIMQSGVVLSVMAPQNSMLRIVVRYVIYFLFFKCKKLTLTKTFRPNDV